MGLAELLEVRPGVTAVIGGGGKTSLLRVLGEELARRITAYREERGPFKTVEDLTDVSGIGQGKLAALEGLVTVEEIE